jgi:hypothetical protein
LNKDFTLLGALITFLVSVAITWTPLQVLHLPYRQLVAVDED